MDKQNISDLKDGTQVNSVFSVKYKHPVREYKNGFMFTVGLADKTGETELSYFGSNSQQKVEEIYKKFDVEDVIFVQGIGNEYRGRVNISVNEDKGMIRKAKAEEYSMEMFLHHTNQDIEKMFGYLQAKINEIKNEHLKKLMDSFFKDKEFVEIFKKSPAAMYYHHACVGGLLEHVWGILQICEAAYKLHPSMDNDLIIAGAILHDIGKIEEFKTTSNIKVTEKGMLLGHITIGYDMINERIKTIPDFPDDLKNKMLHIIISHHGKLEYGAVKQPQFPEAATVFMADHMDSQLTQYIRMKKDIQDKTEDFRTFSKNLGEIYLR